MTPSWAGSGGVADRLVQHVGVCGLAVGICSVLGIPAGLWLGRRHRDRRAGGLSIPALVTAGRAVPPFAVLAALAVLSSRVGVGDPTVVTVVALVLCGLPPLLVATYRGTRAVDPAVHEVSRGLGVPARGELFSLDLPLATPALLGGLRRCAVRVVAVATTAALVAGPGLGEIVLTGLRRHDDAEVLTGAVAVTVLALAVDLALVGLGHLAGRWSPG